MLFWKLDVAGSCSHEIGVIESLQSDLDMLSTSGGDLSGTKDNVARQDTDGLRNCDRQQRA